MTGTIGWLVSFNHSNPLNDHVSIPVLPPFESAVADEVTEQLIDLYARRAVATARKDWDRVRKLDVGSHITLARSDTRSGRTVRTHLTRRTAGNDPASPGERIRSSSSRGKTRDRRFRRTKALVAGQHCRAHGTRVGPPMGHGSLLGLADLLDN